MGPTWPIFFSRMIIQADSSLDAFGTYNMKALFSLQCLIIDLQKAETRVIPLRAINSTFSTNLQENFD
jgi:hypothetical protein